MLHEYNLLGVERVIAVSIMRGESERMACARLGLRRSEYKALVHRVFRRTGSATQLEMVSRLRNPARESSSG